MPTVGRERYLLGLQSDEPATLTSSLKTLKNIIIGHQEQKALFVKEGLVPILLDKIRLNTNENVRIQAALVLASLVHDYKQGIQQVSRQENFQSLLESLADPSCSQSLRLALLRCLKYLVSGYQTRYLLDGHPQLVPILDTVIRDSSNSVKVFNCTLTIIPILSRYHAAPMRLAGLDIPLTLLVTSQMYRLNDNSSCCTDKMLLPNAMFALSSTLSDTVAKDLLENSAVFLPEVNPDDLPRSPFLNELISHLRSPHTVLRLATCALLSRLYQKCTSSEAQRESIALPLLPTLVRFLDEPHPDRRVVAIMADLFKSQGKVCERAVEAGIIKKLVKIVSKTETDGSDIDGEELIVNALNALAAIGVQVDEYRKAILETDILNIVTKTIAAYNRNPSRINERAYSEDKDGMPEFGYSTKVQIAACNILRALSRSIGLLRTKLAESGIVDGISNILSLSEPDWRLEKLLAPRLPPLGPSVSGEEEIQIDAPSSGQLTDVRMEGVENEESNAAADLIEEELELDLLTAAMAATCNFILEFSPLRKPLLDRGVLSLIVQGTQCVHAPLRLNSVWALKHLVFSCEEDEKQMILNEVSCQLLFHLCYDPELAVQEQALDVIRNLICRDEQTFYRIIENMGIATFFGIVVSKLSMPEVAGMAEEEGDHEKEQEAEAGYEDKPPEGDESSHGMSTSVFGNENYIGSKAKYQSQVIIAAIYILVHTVATSERARDYVTSRDDILESLLKLSSHPHPEIRVACIWTLINLTWLEHQGDQNLKTACTIRAKKLAQFGFREVLSRATTDSTMDVRERSETAIYQMETLLDDHDN